MNDTTQPLNQALSPERGEGGNTARAAAMVPGSVEAPEPESGEFFVTVAEHEQGWKEIEVEYRSGKRERVKILAAPSRKLQAVGPVLEKGGDVTGLLLPLALPGVAPEFLDRLTLASLRQVEDAMIELAFGRQFVVKLRAALAQLKEKPAEAGDAEAATAREDKSNA